jgi:hypothetical protein
MGWWWREPIRARAGLVYWQHRCLTLSLPADRVVYDEDPDAAAELFRSGDVEFVNIAHRVSPARMAGHRPGCLTKFMAAGWGPGTFTATDAVIILHEMRSRTGVVRLVLVERGLEDTQPLYAPFELRPTVIEPAGWWRGGPTVMTPTANRLGPIDIASSILKPARIRMFAGQIDPGDAAHFTIRYEMDEEAGGRGAGTIDGRLSDDGSHVTMTVRDGPARPPSRWGTPIIPDP